MKATRLVECAIINYLYFTITDLKKISWCNVALDQNGRRLKWLMAIHSDLKWPR